MSIPKAHHYVPRAFFKPWANAVKQVVVYEEKNNLILPPYRQSTKSICVVDGLYAYTDSIEEYKRDAIERKLLSVIDDKAAKVLQKLQTINGEVVLSDQERYSFSAFLTSIRIRTPEAFLSGARHGAEALRKSLLEHVPELENPEIQKELQGSTLLEWAEKNQQPLLENIGRQFMAQFFTDMRFIQPIMQMHWVVLNIQEDGFHFLTSDRPLVFVSSEGKVNACFALAISPERVFIAATKKNIIDRIQMFSEKEIIANMNISVIEQARSKVFSVDDSYPADFFKGLLGVGYQRLPGAKYLNNS